MKRILLLGGSGRTGRCVLDILLKKGYLVNTLVRDPAKLDVTSHKLKVIAGLSTSKDNVCKAMEGCEAVISTLGALHSSEIITLRHIDPPHTLEVSVRNIITCMDERKLKKIVVQTAFGAGDSRPYSPWFMRFLMDHTNFKIVYEDHNMQEALLKESKLDWVIVRPVGLNDQNEKGHLSIAIDKAPQSRSISRRDVAKFMVDCLESNQYLRQAPNISDS